MSVRFYRPLKPFEGVAIMQGVKGYREDTLILIILALPAFAGAEQMEVEDDDDKM